MVNRGEVVNKSEKDYKAQIKSNQLASKIPKKFRNSQNASGRSNAQKPSPNTQIFEGNANEQRLAKIEYKYKICTHNDLQQPQLLSHISTTLTSPPNTFSQPASRSDVPKSCSYDNQASVDYDD